MIIIDTTAHSEPRPSFEASASCPCSLHHSSNFSPPVSFTPSFHLSFGLPLCLLPSTTATRTLLAGFCSSSQMTCPAHLRRLILMYVTMTGVIHLALITVKTRHTSCSTTLVTDKE
jgi:hypothetical protein